MQTLTKFFLNSCKKSTELTNNERFNSLTFIEKLQLKAHKAICKTCNSYESQSKFIDNLLSRWFDAENKKATPKLDTEKKQQIINTIKQE